jgi:uncharacterized protein YbjT (DUF2867 family)
MTMPSSSRIANPRFVDAGANNFRNRIAVPVGRTKTTFIDVRDIAAVAVRVLTETGHENQRYTLTGSEALDYYEVAARLSAALGRTIRYTNPNVLAFL